MLNFKKNGIFTRQAPREDAPPQQEPQDGILAVWGSPGSGKTVTAVKLAKHLADRKKNVVLLLCDMTAPMLPCICPPSELEGEHSLGSILAAAHVTEPLIKHNLVTLKKHKHLTILGMKKGENEYTYPPYEQTQAQELLDNLRKIAPFVVVDCGSYIANDILSAVALMEADSVLRLVKTRLELAGNTFHPPRQRFAACERRLEIGELSLQPAPSAPGFQMGCGEAVQGCQQCKTPAGRGADRAGAGLRGLYPDPFAGAGGTVPCRESAGAFDLKGQPSV